MSSSVIGTCKEVEGTLKVEMSPLCRLPLQMNSTAVNENELLREPNVSKIELRGHFVLHNVEGIWLQASLLRKTEMSSSSESP